jgi:hypothetical protein
LQIRRVDHELRARFGEARGVIFEAVQIIDAGNVSPRAAKRDHATRREKQARTKSGSRKKREEEDEAKFHG